MYVPIWMKRSVTNLSHGRFVVKDPYIIIKIQRHCFISVANILILMLSLMAFTIWLSRTLQWQLSVCMAEHCSPFSFRNTNAENHHFLPLSQQCMHALTGGIEWWRLVTPEGTAPTSLLKEREREMGKPAFLKCLSSTLSSVTTTRHQQTTTNLRQTDGTLCVHSPMHYHSKAWCQWLF